MTWYLTICAKGEQHPSAETRRVVDFLSSLPELRQNSPVSFESAAGQPWVAIVLAQSNSTDCYACSGEFVPHINVIDLVCSNYSAVAWYETLAGVIANFLGWTATEEDEQRQVYPPKT